MTGKRTATNPSQTARTINRTLRRSACTLLAAAVLVLTSCSTPPTAANRPAATLTPATTGGAIDGLVDIGDGRSMYVKCAGTGSPTVVLIAGKGNGAADWQQIVPPGDPVLNATGDDLSAGLGTTAESADAVFPSVARFTRVCTYDRPDVRVEGAVTTPREQPHTADLDASDLHVLFEAIGETGPKVFVAHSYGGVVTELYGRTYPDEVAGLVMVDTASQYMADVVSPEKLATWDQANAMTSPQVREGVRLIDAFARINAAPPMPKVPAVVLTADKPWRVDLLPPEVDRTTMVTFDDWQAQLDRLAEALGAVNITETNSGHNIYQYSPRLVVESIHSVVEDVQGGASPTPR